MFNWFFGKKEVKRIEEEVKRGFESVKKDITSVGGWIKHLESEKNIHKKEIEDIKEFLSSIKEEVEHIQNVISMMGELKTGRVLKTPKQLSKKQTAVYGVQTAVQTAVQTPFFDQFSITERAIIWILLNTDMKLSYDDLAAMLGKERSTIRGQINSIKQKSDLIEEQVEKNGKKRVYIPESIKEKLLKKYRVSVDATRKKRKKKEK